MRFAVRRRLCVGADRVDWSNRQPPACVRGRWDNDDVQPSGVYDGVGDKGSAGLGEDARAIIDRASMDVRLSLARDQRLPAKLRLDIALTNYGRAVQLQDDAAVDASARELVGLLPLMAEQFRAVMRSRPGPDKRFAEFLVLAMIPGVRTDLVDYVRPEGQRVADYQAHWTDWLILRRPDPASAAPALVAYEQAGSGFTYVPEGTWPDWGADLTCLGECGRGAAPLIVPEFIRARAKQAAQERAFFFKTDHPYGRPPPPTPPARSMSGTRCWPMLRRIRPTRACPRLCTGWCTSAISAAATAALAIAPSNCCTPAIHARSGREGRHTSMTDEL